MPHITIQKKTVHMNTNSPSPKTHTNSFLLWGLSIAALGLFYLTDRLQRLIFGYPVTKKSLYLFEEYSIKNTENVGK